MEILTSIISFGLLIGIITSPVLILVRLDKMGIKHTFITFLALGMIITSIIFLLFAWWADASDQILLSHYGYDFDAMNDIERFTNVSEENLRRVKSLEASIMGVGWPLKALIIYVAYSPYLLILYVLTYLIKKYKKIYSTRQTS
jgi:hypothetical protein